MNNFNPSIYNELLENATVDNQDFEVIELSDVLPEHFIKEIYDSIKDLDSTRAYVQKFVGHMAWSPKPSKDLESFLNSMMTSVCGQEMSLREYSLLRYSNEFGYKPKLFPHFDSHDHPGQRLTLDIQMASTIDWDVFVEEERFSLRDNSAIIFSGTQQIHWRDSLELKDGDYTDVLLCHFEYVPSRQLSENQKNILEYKSYWTGQRVNITNQEVKL